jgi:DNA-binding response OmpR family regulator
MQRQLLVRLVENLGYEVNSVESTEQATAAFQRQPYNLVILDCDCSETSGLEIARNLRYLEGGAERTPIIGMTANGGQEHRKLREEAGIDNYIAKPILRENVEALLARYAPAKEVKAVQRYLALDRHRLKELDELAGGSPELLCGWIEMFVAAAPSLLARMRAADENRDAKEMCDAANQLRSRSGQIGALRVQEICGIAAALAGAGNLAGIPALLPEIAIALERVLRELQSLEDDIKRGNRLSPATPAGAHERPVRRTSGIHVLLAEGDSLIARFLLNSLTGAGFVVSHVSGGAALLDALRGQEYGVVVLDLDVREVDGYSVLSEIRMRPEGAVPVLIVSSRRQEQDILRAFELGADDYITIPFSPLEVVARVRRLAKQGVHVS